MATAFVFASVIVKTEVTPVPTVAGAKTFATPACASTVSVAAAPAAVPAFVVVTLPVLLTYVAAVALVTFTVTVQAALPGTVAPESATLVPLLAAVTVP